jgi:hypothetical protein
MAKHVFVKWILIVIVILITWGVAMTWDIQFASGRTGRIRPATEE